MPSDIPDQLPDSCEITFVQILSRHAARDPTASKTKTYNATLSKITTKTASFPGKYAFLKNYTYDLGEDQLTKFGQQQMVNSGEKFYNRYASLAQRMSPFVRTTGEKRVVDSAKYWDQGFHAAKIKGGQPDKDFPYPMVIMEENERSNNTLDHGLCTAFESGAYSRIKADAQAEWIAVFAPQILDRLKNDLPGVDLYQKDLVNLMQMCPFDTVAHEAGAISPFCDLFSPDEFHQLDYYETLDKYYGFSNGNPLGPTQGVGFAAELLARLTGKPVQDETSTNRTLVSDPSTFPLDKQIYADFSHDNDMVGIFSALGLYNSTPPLSNTTRQDVKQTKGFSSSWVVPFAARAYFEKMKCTGSDGELVRVIVNDRVIPLENCGADELGRCELNKFVESQGFVRMGGHWNACFEDTQPRQMMTTSDDGSGIEVK